MTDKVDLPHYFQALMRDMEAGGITVMEVAHDDWCQHWKGKPCNCDPDISRRPVKDDDDA